MQGHRRWRRTHAAAQERNQQLAARRLRGVLRHNVRERCMNDTEPGIDAFEGMAGGERQHSSDEEKVGELNLWKRELEQLESPPMN